MGPILEIRDLGKQYRLGGGPPRNENFREFVKRKVSSGFRSRDRSLSQRQRSEELFWALRDVSFDVNEGDVIGILGRNGAGKSTLLKIISRITDPTEGIVKVRGRLASLLEVGTGFHPELTGRENIFLNGAILGLRRAEILARFDEIVAFSEIEKFLDTPVKRYSSGMYVRLAFAVAAHLNPEILIVDEVLSVGDMAFQKKCLGKMGEVSQGGRTVLFVSHNMAAIENLCRTGMVLDQGKMAYEGGAKEAVEYYVRKMAGNVSALASHVIDLRSAPRRYPRLSKLLTGMKLFKDDNNPLTVGLRIGEHLQVHVDFELPDPTNYFDVGLGFDNMFGQRVLTAHSMFEPDRPRAERVGMQTLVCDIPSLTLTPGEYSLHVWLQLGNSDVDSVNNATCITILESDYYGTGKVPRAGTCVMKQRWRLEEPRLLLDDQSTTSQVPE